MVVLGTAVAMLSGSLATFAQQPEQLPLLMSSEWSLTELDGVPVPRGAGITATFFPSGRVTGSSGCNPYQAVWQSFGTDRLVITAIQAARDRCKAPSSRREAAYLDLLDDATSFMIAADTLTVTTAFKGPLLFRAGRPSPGLILGQWRLAAIDGTPLPEALGIDATFDEAGTVSGTGGCNDYDGPYAIRGDTIRIGPLLTMRASCDPAVDRVEAAFLDALEAAGRWSVDGTTLRLRAAGGGRPLELEAVMPLVFDSLTDAAWTLVRFGSTTVPSGTGMTASFAPDGTISGSGGCNTFAGTYATDGAVLSIEIATTTSVPCDQSVLGNEAVYLDALRSALGWKLPENHLWITTQDGIRLVFEGTPVDG
jgi:heat shock protein HslJ